MIRVFEFTVASTIHLDSVKLWSGVTNMQGVNYELAPFVKMTIPKKYRNLTIQDAPLGEKLFKSIILLFQFIPVDFHHFNLDKVSKYEKFEENSTSLMHYFWKHERVLLTVADGTKLTDTVQFYPRFPLIGYFLKPVYLFIFRHRHQRLKNKFNSKN